MENMENMENMDTRLKLIIEDTAIDITCWAKNQKEVDDNIKFAHEDAYDLLYNTIDDRCNIKIYNPMIDKLVDYSLHIIDTYWGDTQKYIKHIDFIKKLQEEYKSTYPCKLNPTFQPFMNKINIDLQDYILDIKYLEEKKYWKRYLFLKFHTDKILDYLKIKKDSSEDEWYN